MPSASGDTVDRWQTRGKTRVVGMPGRRPGVISSCWGAGVIALVVSAGLARPGVFEWEIRAFRAVNDLPGALQPVVWVLNQYGTAVTIPLVAAAAVLFRRWAPAASLAATGIAVYVLAKVLKEYVERGRPGALLESIVEREAFAPGSLGFPSGHVAVACAITALLLPRARRPWQLLAATLAIVVSFARLYIGAHLPLDVLGGAALGVTAASAVNLVLHIPATREGRDNANGMAARVATRNRPMAGNHLEDPL